jgi:hypothetical protein
VSPFSREAFGLVAHFLVATIAGTFLCSVSLLFFSVLLSTLGIRIGRVSFYDPFFWVPALLLGYLVARRLRHRSARLEGVLAGLLLLLLISFDVASMKRAPYYIGLTEGHYWDYEFRDLFLPNDRTCASSERLGQLLFTWPFVAAVAYSIGAWLSLRFGSAKTISTAVAHSQ